MPNLPPIAEPQGEPSNEELAHSARGGSRESFALLYQRFYTRTFRLAYGMTSNKEAAEDMTQEIFMRAFQKLDKFDFKSSFYTWFYRLAFNQCVNYRQRKLSTRESGLEESNIAPDLTHMKDVEQAILEQQVQAQIHQAILTLKPKLRLIIILKEIEGMSYDELARHLEISMGTVASRLNRARQLLAQQLAHLKGTL
ncbi:MAG TPA: sigma-70 family RNA polymerase sigma factor [Pyrinomonadaceae bacterium]